MVGRKHIAESHTWVEARLSDYLDDQLAANERARLEAHLADCDQCRASLALLRWTVALVKQAPAPELPHSFTLPVPAQRTVPQRAPAFGALRWATVLATLLFCVVIGVDAITHLGNSAMPPNAVSAAQAVAVAPTMAALALQPSTQPQAAESTRLADTAAPKPAVPPAPAPTQVFGLGGGTADNSTDAPRSSTPGRTPRPALARAPTISNTVTAPRAAGIAPTATPTSAPTITATPVLPTVTLAPTRVAIAQIEPTLAPRAANPAPRETISSLRVAEIGLLFVVVFLATLTILLRPSK